MPNMLDYIHWRGDLSFQQDPPNMVDNLIFSEIAYCDFLGIVPSPAEGGAVSLAGACDRYLSARLDQPELVNNPRPVLIAAAASPRFREVALSAFTDVVDAEKQVQFSALTFTLPSGTAYVAFRGTDTTITGWREDFNMSFLPETPGQQAAAAYLTEAARRTGLPLVAGGHSKGGNLAVYAAAFAEPDLQEQIVTVCSNDGPGFNSKVADSPQYARIIPKVRLFLPESSLVGILMANQGQRYIVKSSARGAMQHDPYSWEVLGPSFIFADSLSASSLFMDETMRRWLDGLSDEEKQVFTEAIFGALEEERNSPGIDLHQTPANLVRAMTAGVRILTGEKQAEFRQTAQKLLMAGGSTLIDGGIRLARESRTALRSALAGVLKGLDSGFSGREKES